jgi:hypothetical protein
MVAVGDVTTARSSTPKEVQYPDVMVCETAVLAPPLDAMVWSLTVIDDPASELIESVLYPDGLARVTAPAKVWIASIKLLAADVFCDAIVIVASFAPLVL